jgi:hypothetical protein
VPVSRSKAESDAVDTHQSEIAGPDIRRSCPGLQPSDASKLGIGGIDRAVSGRDEIVAAARSPISSILISF